MKLVAALLLMTATALAKPPAGSTARVDHVIVLVDGRPIWHSELEELYERSQLTKPSFDQTQLAIDSLIDSALIDNAATRLHVEVTDTDLDSAITMIKQQNSIDDAGLDKALAEQHFTRASYREEIARQLRVAKVFNADFASHVQISEDEIKATYELVKKMDASTGTFEKEHDRMRGMVFEKKAAAAQTDWLVKAKATAHIEKR
ncbi:MAG: SurA N-terminal domain-containing protein [Kofleriaceae bacterium]